MQEMMNTNYPGASAKQPNSPPVLGGQLPGLTSELPAPRGLTPYFNPMAQELQSYGRNGDSMLIHMHPDEVKGLQQLAMAHGGSLTINPHTGLPEAGFLKKLLPTILGAVLAPFTGGLSAALIVGAGYTVATGSLQKGLMAGLGAFGGAGIGNAIANIGSKGLAAFGGQAAKGLAGEAAKGALPGTGAAGVGAAGNVSQLASLPAGVGGATTDFGVQAAQAVAGEGVKQAATEAAKQGVGQIAKTALTNTGTGLKALGEAAMKNPLDTAQRFGRAFSEAARGDLAPGSFMYKYAPQAAGMGAFTNIADAMQPDMPTYSAPEETKWTYDGPYTMPFQQVSYPGADDESSAEHAYFTQSNPTPGYRPAKAMSLDEEEGGYADGGLAALPASDKFKELVAFYNAKRPGPITASIKPTKPEKKQLTSSDVRATSATPTVPPTVTVSPEVLEPSRGRFGPYVPGVGWGNSDFSNLGINRAAGGPVNMDDGSFVVDARTVSELGNGSSNAGIEHLQKLGGRPIQGPGDGVSDSIPASIGGRQPARVARDEVIFPPQAVRRMGGGNEKRGTQKLYAMMDKAHAARKRAGRGTDTKLRRGLA